MPTYTVQGVERLLKHYLDIRFTLEARGQQLPDTYAVKPQPRPQGQLPFGQTPQGTPWPFMEPRRARSNIDGKRKARLIEDLHVSCLDIEAALKRMTDDDLELIYKYFILQTHNLDDLVAERGVTSRGSMQRRVRRAAERLTREMEHGYE